MPWVLLLAWAVCAVSGASWYVSPGGVGDCSLGSPCKFDQGVIDLANSGDDITAAAGTYSDFPGVVISGKELDFTSTDAFINCEYKDMVAFNVSESTVSLHGFTIVRCVQLRIPTEYTEVAPGLGGGALWATNSSVNLNNCVFAENYGRAGAVMIDCLHYTEECSVTVSNCDFVNNNATEAMKDLVVRATVVTIYNVKIEGGQFNDATPIPFFNKEPGQTIKGASVAILQEGVPNGPVYVEKLEMLHYGLTASTSLMAFPPFIFAQCETLHLVDVNCADVNMVGRSTFGTCGLAFGAGNATVYATNVTCTDVTLATSLSPFSAACFTFIKDYETGITVEATISGVECGNVTVTMPTSMLSTSELRGACLYTAEVQSVILYGVLCSDISVRADGGNIKGGCVTLFHGTAMVAGVTAERMDLTCNSADTHKCGGSALFVEEMYVEGSAIQCDACTVTAVDTAAGGCFVSTNAHVIMDGVSCADHQLTGGYAIGGCVLLLDSIGEVNQITCTDVVMTATGTRGIASGACVHGENAAVSIDGIVATSLSLSATGGTAEGGCIKFTQEDGQGDTLTIVNMHASDLTLRSPSLIGGGVLVLGHPLVLFNVVLSDLSFDDEGSRAIVESSGACVYTDGTTSISDMTCRDVDIVVRAVKGAAMLFEGTVSLTAILVTNVHVTGTGFGGYQSTVFLRGDTTGFNFTVSHTSVKRYSTVDGYMNSEQGDLEMENLYIYNNSLNGRDVKCGVVCFYCEGTLIGADIRDNFCKGSASSQGGALFSYFGTFNLLRPVVQGNIFYSNTTQQGILALLIATTSVITSPIVLDNTAHGGTIGGGIITAASGSDVVVHTAQFINNDIGGGVIVGKMAWFIESVGTWIGGAARGQTGSAAASIGGSLYLDDDSAVVVRDFEFGDNEAGTGHVAYIKNSELTFTDVSVITDHPANTSFECVGSDVTILRSSFTAADTIKGIEALSVLCPVCRLITDIAPSPCGPPRTLRVAPTGTDDDECLEGTTPCRTIGFALEYASSGDEVHVESGVYTGALNTDLNFGKRAITLVGIGRPVIACGPDADIRAFTLIDDGDGAVIRGFHVRDCHQEFGAAVYVSECSPIFEDCEFSLNSGSGPDSRGGAVFVDTGAGPTFTDCVFRSNEANEGGAVFALGDLTMRNCELSGNHAATGGAIMRIQAGGAPSALHLSSCVISNNTAASGSGGGVLLSGTRINVTGSSFLGNSANLNGGGAMVELAGNDITLNNVNISDNIAVGDGGGVYTESNPTFNGCTFRGNSAYSGGGARVRISTPTFNSCVFHGNTATFYGGGAEVSHKASPRLNNCSFIENSATLSGAGLHALEAFVYFVGGTFEREAEADAALSVNAFSFLSILGSARFVENRALTAGGAIGTLESGLEIEGATFISNVASSGGAMSCSVTLGTISDTVFLDNTALSSSGGALLWNGLNVTIRNVTAEGNRAADDGAALYFFANSDKRSPGPRFISLEDITLLNNVAEGDGAVHVELFSSLEVKRVVARGNEGQRGPVLTVSDVDTMLVEDSVFEDNFAELDGGAVHVDKVMSATFRETTMTANAGTDGGALHVTLAEYGDLYLESVRLEGNYAVGRGGGVYCLACSYVHLEDCEFQYNEADLDGGAAFLTSTDIDITGGTFAFNTALNGGALRLKSCTASVVGAQLHNNSAGANGGALLFERGAVEPCVGAGLTLQEASFVHNTGERGGAAFTIDDAGVYNTSVFTGNVGRQYGNDLASKETSVAWMNRPKSEFQSGQPLVGEDGNAPHFVLRDVYGSVVSDSSSSFSISVSSSELEIVGPTFLLPILGVVTLDVSLLSDGTDFILYCNSSALAVAPVSLVRVTCSEMQRFAQTSAFSKPVCQNCETGSYSFRAVDTCLLCEPGLVCDNSVVEVSVNHYLINNTNVDPPVPLAIECPPLFCLGSKGGQNVCRPGHSGRLCATCDDGRALWHGTCEVCKEADPFGIVFLIVCGMTFVVALVRLQRSLTSRLNILTFFGQTMGLLFLEGSAVGESVSAFWSAFNMSPETYPGRCVVPLSFALRYVIAVLVVPGFLFLVLGFYFIVEVVFEKPGEAIKEKLLASAVGGKLRDAVGSYIDTSPRRTRYLGALLAAAVFVYTPVTKAVLTSLDCRKLHPDLDIRLLNADLSVDCSTGDYIGLQVVSFFLVALYVVPFPFVLLGLVLWLSKKDKLREESTQLRFGMLFVPYREKIFWWEFVMQARKMVVVGTFVIFAFDEHLRMVVFVFVFLLMLVFQTAVAPHVNKSENRLEVICLSTTAAVATILASNWFNDNTNSGNQQLAVVLTIISVMPLAVFVSEFAYRLRAGVTSEVEYEDDDTTKDVPLEEKNKPVDDGWSKDAQFPVADDPEDPAPNGSSAALVSEPPVPAAPAAPAPSSGNAPTTANV